MAELEKKWNEEKQRVEELRGLREKLEAHAAASKQTGNDKTDGKLSPEVRSRDSMMNSPRFKARAR